MRAGVELRKLEVKALTCGSKVKMKVALKAVDALALAYAKVRDLACRAGLLKALPWRELQSYLCENKSF